MLMAHKFAPWMSWPAIGSHTMLNDSYLLYVSPPAVTWLTVNRGHQITRCGGETCFKCRLDQIYAWHPSTEVCSRSHLWIRVRLLYSCKSIFGLSKNRYERSYKNFWDTIRLWSRFFDMTRCHQDTSFGGEKVDKTRTGMVFQRMHQASKISQAPPSTRWEGS